MGDDIESKVQIFFQHLGTDDEVAIVVALRVTKEEYHKYGKDFYYTLSNRVEYEIDRKLVKVAKEKDW
jgi:hypothetical protein